MAGLACGEPSLLAWQEPERAAVAFMAVPDEGAVDAMRLFASDGIVSGKSAGAASARRRCELARTAASCFQH